MPKQVTETVYSYTGRYGQWLLDQGWDGHANHVTRRVQNWVNIKNPTGSHGGAKPAP